MKLALTGHRPKYCPCKYDESHPWFKDLIARLWADFEIGWSTGQIDAVISGMAIGFDTWGAEVAMEIGIPVHAYIPFKGQHLKWPAQAQERYKKNMHACEKIVICSESYSKTAFHKRDRAMIDNAEIVATLLDPLVDSGGTAYTVNYAKSRDRKIIDFWRDN